MMSMILSIWSIPDDLAVRARLRRRTIECLRDRAVQDLVHERRLAEPDTPVTHVNSPRGKLAVIPRRLCSVAFSTTRLLPLCLRRSVARGS